MSKTIIKNSSQLLTLGGHSDRPKVGKEMNELGIIEKGCVAIDGEKIIAVGSLEQVEAEARLIWGSLDGVEFIDAQNQLVMPGMIDPHTHLVFAGSREYELEMRLKGASYLEILQAGGGILASTKMTQAASEEELLEQATTRVDAFLRQGVTTLEAKSGYGLTLQDELKQLRVAKKLGETHPIDIISTFMGAHAVPPEYKADPDKYVDIVIEQMIPAVAEKGLASFCDVFCEQGVFTCKQSHKILEAGTQYGLIPKIHADEIVQTGGAELAAQVGAISADHLLQASDQGIKMMSEAGVIAVLLPGTAFFLMAQYARGREMIDSGVPVALSTDRNPGSSPTESIQFIMNLACFNMKMTPAEVLSATTINAAHAIGQADKIGSIEVGKQADILIMNAPNYVYLQYNYGMNLVRTVIKRGIILTSG